MIKNIVIILCALSIPMHAMELSPHKLTIKDLQHKRNVLIETLKEKPHYFFMWTPEDDGFSAIYKAKNYEDLTKVVYVCKSSMRIQNYSILGIIVISPNIETEKKKKIIRDALTNGFVSTPGDKELAIVEAWERCKKTKFVQNIYLLDFFPSLLQELINSIKQFIIEIETKLLLTELLL